MAETPPKSDHRRALTLLAEAPSGRAERSLLVQGLTIDLLADLIAARLATATIEADGRRRENSPRENHERRTESVAHGQIAEPLTRLVRDLPMLPLRPCLPTRPSARSGMRRDEAKPAFRAGGWAWVRAGRQSPLPGKADEKASGRKSLGASASVDDPERTLAGQRLVDSRWNRTRALVAPGI
jgi:hypothetical protein